ncbi:hypothetical protein SODG_007608 [Sodalis praecaptivus]
MPSFIDEVRAKANGHWEPILERLGISTNRKESECPSCGGETRYRFDDLEGRGTYLCSHCGSGTGLDLVMKVKQCTAPEAATMVAEEMSMPLPEKKPAKEKPLRPIAERVAALVKSTHMGESVYLNNKGLQGPHPLLKDGSLLLVLRTMAGTVTGAQTIRPTGEKRLLAGTKKKGAFIPVGDIPENPDSVVITEGYATALTVQQIRPDAFTVAAIDCGNLRDVAEVMNRHYPNAQIIIAADNDIKPDERNKGKEKAESAATAVSGWVTLPPTDHKSDWDEYRQQHGLEAATFAFNERLSHFTPAMMIAERRALADGEALADEDIKILETINGTYTHVTIGGKHRVVSLKPCQVNGVTHVFEDISQFRNYFLHCERIARKPAGVAWLNWPGKNYKPGGVGFYPSPSKCPESVYNLFTGLSVEPTLGDCSPYLEHLRQVICAGDETSYAYLIGWMAHLIQRPDEKPSVAIVMKSIPGTGKGTMVRPLQDILGQYAIHINGAGQIAGKFNATMANKLLIFADEVTVGRNYEGDRLKGIISEKSINLERKGIDPEPMPNFARLIFASNSIQALKAGIRERRYLVLEPNPAHAQEKGYFDNLHNWLHDNGAARLLHFLQHYDLGDFDCYRAPQTAALQDEILLGLTGFDAYLYSELSKDRPFNEMARIPVSELIDKYLMWCKENGEHEKPAAARRRVGSTLSRMGLESSGRRGRNLGVIYELPTVDRLQLMFAEFIGMSLNDVF